MWYEQEEVKRMRRRKRYKQKEVNRIRRSLGANWESLRSGWASDPPGRT